MQRVRHRDVRELKNVFVAQVLLEGTEHAVGHPAMRQHEAVGIGEEGPLERIEQVGHLPVFDRLDLLLGKAQTSAALAVLREDELTPYHPAGAGLTELAQHRWDRAIRAGIE